MGLVGVQPGSSVSTMGMIPNRMKLGNKQIPVGNTKRMASSWANCSAKRFRFARSAVAAVVSMCADGTAEAYTNRSSWASWLRCGSLVVCCHAVSHAKPRFKWCASLVSGWQPGRWFPTAASPVASELPEANSCAMTSRTSAGSVVGAVCFIAIGPF